MLKALGFYRPKKQQQKDETNQTLEKAHFKKEIGC